MNKKKTMAANISDEFGSLNCQHSSLAVNLSCVSNLTDSGNGSLRRTDDGYNNNATSTRINYDRASKTGKYTLYKSERTIIDDGCTSDQINPIKDVRILLEKISNDDIMLNKNCERLKEAILTKTKQVFDTQNMLSVKTQKILKTKQDWSDVTCRNDLSYGVTDTEASAISNKIDQKKKQYKVNQTISNTPKEKYENKNTDEQKKQFKLIKRRLFDVNKSLSNMNTSSNNVNLKCNSSKLYLSQIENKNDEGSIVLAGSNKKPDTLNLFSNKSRKLIVPSETKKHRIIDSVSCKDRSASVSSNSEDENTFMAVPICCSTMIDEQALDTQNEHSQSVHNSSASLDDNTRKSAVPMEITCLFEKLNDEQQSLEQVIKDITGNLSQQKLLGNAPVSLVHATAKVPAPLYENSRNLRKSVLYNNIDEQCTKIHYNDQSIETTAGSSANTIQTSLNVNTSVDAQKKYSNDKDKSKQKSCREKKYNKSVEHREEKGMCSSVSEKTQESINTNCTSLQMNTSLDALNRLHLPNDNSKRRLLVDKNTDTERNSTNTVNVPKMKDRLENKTPDSRSYIESTPYPTCRRVLLKSQFIQDTNNYHNNKNESKDPTKTNSPKNKSHLSLKNMSAECTNSCYEQEKIENERIIRDNSSREMFSNKSQTTVTRESTNESESAKDQNRENATVISVKRKFKKKLLPLRECSQLLSFSPVDGEIFPPKEPTPIKKRKKLKKEHIKCTVNLRNIENYMKHIERNSNEESLLENDCTLSNKKKPRKIISKKITIKKIVDDDILRRLQKNGEKTVKTRTCNSLNDFQATTGLSTGIFTKRKAQTINIVATGLSNDDKNMIRSVIKALGCAKLELNVTKRTTHVVTTGVRTINLLHGIIRGCWLVKLEWVLKSLESNTWLNPGEYEMTHFSKAALENRKDRQLFGKSYIPELFAACGYIYVGNDTMPPCNVLKDLIKAAGGRIIETPETAKIVIGTQGLKEAWILDCITTGELQPYTQYQQCQSRYKK